MGVGGHRSTIEGWWWWWVTLGICTLGGHHRMEGHRNPILPPLGMGQLPLEVEVVVGLVHLCRLVHGRHHVTTIVVVLVGGMGWAKSATKYTLRKTSLISSTRLECMSPTKLSTVFGGGGQTHATPCGDSSVEGLRQLYGPCFPPIE